MQFLGKFGKIVCWRPPPRENGLKLLFILTQMVISFSFAVWFFFLSFWVQVFTLYKYHYQRRILSLANWVYITFHLGNCCQDSWWYLENPFVSANFTEGTRFLREKKNEKTRMLSSIMRTARTLSYGGRSLSGGLCPGGSLSRRVSVWGVSVRGSMSGGSLSRGSLSRGSLSGGLYPGESLWGLCPGVSVRGVSVWVPLFRGVSLTETPRDGDPLDRDRDPPPCGQTNTCENITFANLVCGR